jgi:DHA1 family inner membrane transport protein
MSFFGNVAINRVNLHYGIQQFAQTAGGIFFLVYMIKAGVPVAMALVAQAAIVAERFVVRSGVVPLARRIGLRRTLMLGTVLEALAFPLLAEIHGVDAAFVALCAITPLGSALYWTCYHAYFAALGDAEARGGQVAFREAMAAIIGIVAPLLGGWLLLTAGPRVAFNVVAGLQVLAALPLIGGPEVPVGEGGANGLRAAGVGAALMATDGWFAACYYYVWQIALFVALDESIAGYAGAVALAAFAGAAVGLLMGRVIDVGHGRRALILAYGVAAGLVALRAASLGSPWLAVTANALGAFVNALLIPALMTPIYNRAKASPCPLRFHVGTEGGWDIGCGLGCLTAAGFVAMGQGLAVPLLLALIGGGAAFAMLWREYPQRA